MSGSGSSIALRALERRFGTVAAVDGVDLEVPAGAFLALLGPSGCGKTTILRMLAGLDAPTGGEIRFQDRVVASGDRGVVVPPSRRDVGLVFQSYALWPHMTVRQNVEWPLKVRRWPKGRRLERTAEVLALLSIAELAERYPGEISGGQQQRVAIARTIATEPSILLFDEPLSNLDARLRAEMRTELLRVHRLTGATSVYVTHDQVEAMTMATHVAVMRSGVIEQFGSPRDLIDRPATPFVASFVGTPPANLLAGHLTDGRYHYKELELGQHMEETETTGPRWLMYRADAVRLHREKGVRRLPVEFAESTPVAGRAIATVWDEGRRLSVVVDDTVDAQLGDRLFLEFPGPPAVVYDRDETEALRW